MTNEAPAINQPLLDFVAAARERFGASVKIAYLHLEHWPAQYGWTPEQFVEAHPEFFLETYVPGMWGFGRLESDGPAPPSNKILKGTTHVEPVTTRLFAR
jgi:hypothetical protein